MGRLRGVGELGCVGCVPGQTHTTASYTLQPGDDAAVRERMCVT